MYEDEKCDWCPRVKYDLLQNINVKAFVVQRRGLTNTSSLALKILK